MGTEQDPGSRSSRSANRPVLQHPTRHQARAEGARAGFILGSVVVMQFERTPLHDAWLISLQRMNDDRGSFARAFCEDEFAAHGLPTHFPQCNISTNTRRGTMRGMHFNAPPFAESKYLRCVRGAVHDVIVDLRRESKSFGRSFGLELSAENGLALFVPGGFAHGFLTLCDDTEVHYYMGAKYQPDAGRGFRWNDPAFAIEWPREPAVISSRDAIYPNFDDTLLDP